TLTYTSVADQNGVAHITVTATDSGTGANTFSRMFTVTVNAVDDPPVITVPGAQDVNQDTNLVFSTGNGNPISVDDVHAGSNEVKVTLDVSHGTLTLSGTTGLTFQEGGNGTAHMVFTGTLTNVNNALEGMVYLNDFLYVGMDAVEITVDDQGNTGSGGPLS